MKSKLLFIANNFDIVIYRFRREVLETFATKGYDITLVTPYSDQAVDFCKNIGIKYIDIKIDRRGKNPFKDIFLLLNFFKIIYQENPDYIFSYTIKPNLYIGILNFIFRKRFYPNVTGLGSMFANNDLIHKFIIFLYRLAFKNATKVFFQNKQNQKVLIDKKIVAKEKSILIPGSGVNLEENKYIEYPKNQEILNFVFLGRIMQEKGVYELLEAFAILEKKYGNIRLDIYGFCDEKESNFKQKVATIKSVNFNGFSNNPREKIANSHAVILPSYHEGMSNVLLEAAAMGRPVIASDIPGCREIFDDSISGLFCKPKDVSSLSLAIEKFIMMSDSDRITMGKKAREKVEKFFDRNIVIKAYLQQVGRG